MTTRRNALGLIGAGLALPRAGWAQARLDYELVPQQILPGVWMIEGAREYFDQQNGGAIVNCTLVQGDTGLILIDSGPSLRYGTALAAAARRLDIRGVSAVVNTHHHPDHYFGNQPFADAPIFALGQTIALARAEGDGFADNMYRLLGDWMRGTEPLPPSDVVEGGDLVIDGRRFAALPLSGHTEADLVLVDAQTGLLIGGDMLFLDRAPTTPHAGIARWLAALDEIEAIGAPGLIPGHGPFDQTGASVRDTRAYLTWLDQTLRSSAAEGLDMVEIMALPLPADFADDGAQPQEFHRSVVHLFPGIERQVLPRGN